MRYSLRKEIKKEAAVRQLQGPARMRNATWAKVELPTEQPQIQEETWKLSGDDVPAELPDKQVAIRCHGW